MKKRKLFSVIIAASLAVGSMTSLAWAEEATTDAAVSFPLLGTYISNAEAVKADEKFAAALEGGQLDESTMMNAIFNNFYSEAYYFDAEGNMVHYTADDGSVPGYYQVSEDYIYIESNDHIVYYPVTITDEAITVNKGGTEIVLTKVLDTTPAQILIEDYTELEISKSDVEVTDEEINSSVDSYLSSQATTEDVTEGTAEDGDTVTISFSGVLEGETDPFEGGTSDSYALTLGSGTMIPGFEEAIVGNEIGSTFDINVTFPEDYSNTDYAGKNATFTITIISKSVTTTPELTDEWVKEFSAANLDTELNSVDELKEYVREKLYDNKLETAIENAIKAKTVILSYNPVLNAMLTQYSEDGLAYYSSMYGLDSSTYAYYCGYSTIAEYTEAEVSYYLDTYMLADKILTDKGIETTEEEIDAAMTEYMDTNGYSASYSLEEFKSSSGDTWLWLFENIMYKYPLAIDALKDNVVLVD